ncbi:amino acid transporter [Colletotrichum kahawae]|uniref:Amino acid transporter n=1 Tax=Colletotrichum kahawae TaxID=34407 RepID=A0AAD9Y1I9_COLKA|nr:amino acid transporter [Colletotrichum kahawae]
MVFRIIVTIGQSLMMSSLAELCSVYPYAGGQQAFTKSLAPRRALVVGGLVQLTHPDFQLQPWAVWLLYAGFIIVSVAFCLSQRQLPLVSAVGATITLGGGIAWGISFLVMAPKASAHFAFTEFMNNSGYTHVGWMGIMSFYAPSYALYGTDGILHIVEEIKDAERNAPRAMIWSMIFSGITSLLSAFLIAFSPGNWQEYLHADFLIIVGINNAASRLAWGLARDNALPFSTALFRINSRLVVFGSDHAFEAIVSLGGVAIQIGYLIPVTMLLVEGRDCLPVNREFSLGRFGKPINMASVIWSSLIIIMLSFPLYVPVTASSILLIILVDWVAQSRFYYSL